MTNRKEYLNPTKATLFGLDIRFRHIDEKVEAEKAARSLSKQKLQKGKANKSNRHVLPKHINPLVLNDNKSQLQSIMN